MNNYRQPLSERDVAVLAFLLQAGEAGSREIRDVLGITSNQVNTSLSKLRARGTIVARGPTAQQMTYFIRPDLRAAALAQNLLATTERPLLEAPA